eukprot:CAMPEP_0201914444 /NCGR_PEP_ID=MMETSP0903-20130614/4618_1 /ASSEMBLY_ACC=CAM_ASM_000552 /TAXON_ID=420261 /ORGANISM="Thalassiosira antarctica, Strain CCMP982" /LENGTH=619 /DNA_ID=CAMNT_0048449823 /DNA_START=141 /DNA_END=2000 /DNA_ORIENTATION=+
MSSELALLRSTLQGLQSYELPATYRYGMDNKENDPNDSDTAKNVDSNDKSSTNTAALLFYNPQLLQRYKSARNSYIQQRTLEMFLTNLQKYDPSTNTLPLPTTDNDDTHKEELQTRKEKVLQLVKGTMEQMTGGMDGVQMKWEQFCEKREELVQIVEGMERGERNQRLEESPEYAKGESDENDTNDDDDSSEITDEDVALQEEKLDNLQRRKLALENRLRSVRAEVLDAEDDCHGTKRVVNEVRVRGGRKPLDWRGLKLNNNSGENDRENGDKEEDETVEYISIVAQEVNAEIAEMEEKASELKKSCDFYDGIRELMEELGGVKILSSKSIPASKVPTDREGESPEKRQKLDEKEQGFVLTLLLLGSHILEITLSKSPGDEEDVLHVSNAKLVTPTTIPMPENSTNNNNENDSKETTTSLMETMHSISLSNLSFSKIMSQKPSVDITIPPLDDLVSWSRSLDATSSSSSTSHGIRFILVETMARLRTLEARVVELSTLRDKYAAQVYDVESSKATATAGGYGGAEQEVVCAINEGITVALRLGADCPLVPGSVYVSEMFGVGGWEDAQLEELKKVVLRKRCRGPVEVMECMVEEIQRRSDGEEEGWVVPGTPSLPGGKK